MSSRSKARAILNQLAINDVERRELRHEARRRAGKLQFLWDQYIGYWVCALLLIVGGAPGIIASLELLFGELPNPMRIVMLAGLILGLGWGAWWLFRRMNFGDTATPLMEILHERGYRWCRNCNYNLRSLPPETELCPECGTYISPHFTGDPDNAPPLQIQADSLNSPGRMRHAIAWGIDIEPARLEQAWLMMRGNGDAKHYRIGNVLKSAVLPAFLVVVLLLTWGFHKLIPNASPIIIWLALLIGFGVVIFMILLLLTAPAKRRMVRRLRAALRETGIELCVQCGQYLGDLDPDVAACTRCRSEREPFASPATCAAETGASPQPGRDDSL